MTIEPGSAGKLPRLIPCLCLKEYGHVVPGMDDDMDTVLGMEVVIHPPQNWTYEERRLNAL